MTPIKQLSKTIADRLSFGDQVRHAIRAQRALVLDGLVGRHATALPARAALEAAVDWLDGALGDAGDRLREADLVHSAELADDGPHRAARDEAAKVLEGTLIGVRSVVSGTYGDGFAVTVGFSTPSLPSRPDQLVTLGVHVSRQLRAVAMPSPLIPGARLDLAATAADLEAKTTALDSALGDVRREEREAQSTLGRRDAAREEYARVYSGASEVFAGLCTLAGLDDLAQKVRPTARRRAGIPDAPTEPSPAGES